MSVTRDRVGPARTNGLEMIDATQIRRPCNSKPGRVISSGLVAQEKNDLIEYLRSL